MLELIQNVIDRLKDVWSSMTLNQKVVSGAVIAALILVAIFLTTLTGGITEYSLLFADLDARSASEIIAYLEQSNIPFRTTRGGTAIEVPPDRVDRLKIDLVSQGLPESGVVGYEILESIGFGTSSALQDVQIQRALEGELIKTLKAFDEIENANVKLFIPEPSLYTETAKKPTASVTLKLRRNRKLPQESVNTITNIIGSATGIDPSDVSVADTRSGILLTKPAMDEMTLMSNTRREWKTLAEYDYAQKVLNILEPIIGVGKVRVSVNADLDFDKIERVKTSYDQGTSAIRSEEREEITNPTADGGGEERTLTNYETGMTVENFISSPGNTKKLSVSVMIDTKDTLTVDEDGDNQIEKVQWKNADITRFRTMCESAVGFDVARGDRIEVIQEEFAREFDVEPGGRLALQATLVDGVKALSTGMAILAGLVVFFIILRQITRSLDPSKITLQIESILEREKKDLIVEEESESDRSALIRKIITKAAQDPEITAKTIRTIYRDVE
ncbi:MAG: flagellar M-ring protein FliF [Candidatus Latescibacteria bacterium]|nr:flagellar M-ring protein FliF [Candidatus Latescibacterota bacterium]